MAIKRNIPQVPLAPDAQRRRFDIAVKEALDRLMGRLPDQAISTLETTATNAEIIAKINQIINRLQN